MNNKALKIILALLILIILGIGAYWYFFMRMPASSSSETGGNSTSTGFNPLGRNPVSSSGTSGNPTSSSSPIMSSTSTPGVPIPILRLLSDTPIGGYSASTTGTTTAVRWIDRGRGNILEARSDTLDIQTISNTLLPRVYTSVWNANLTAFVASLLPDNASAPTTVYANLVKQSSPASTASSTPSSSFLTPYALKGSSLPDGIIGYAVSPRKNQVFFLIAENGGSAGYIASFDGTSMTKIFTTPLTQLNVDWPADNDIAITTKGAANAQGYLYLVDPKTGIWTKAIGPLPGFSAKVSHDAKYAIISAAGNANNMVTAIYDLQRGTDTDAVIRTLADKCAWGNFYKDLVYCGVPSQQIAGTYPDDWYKGSVSFTDKIWQINAETGELHLVSSIVDQSDRVIDAFNLGLDPKDNYLFFMDKNDLSFWSLDLVDQQQ